MAEETTYLELSEEGGGAHKFYEVIVRDTQVSIRYGRIGDAGQTQNSSYATPEEARKFAQKKIQEKTRSGYAAAVMGGRARRAVTRRQVVSVQSTAKQAPVLWRFASGSPAFGIFIDERACWLGNQAGHIFALDGSGQPKNQFSLPEGVKCLVGDHGWVYAGCDNGKVYDLTGKVPRESYEIAEGVDIYWLDIHDGHLGVSDEGGNVALVDQEDTSLWQKKTQYRSGWMVRCDAASVYHGHSGGVTGYDRATGAQRWQQKTGGSVLFGWQEAEMVYAGTSDNKVYSFKKDGTPGTVYRCDDTIYSCATAPQGKYVFAGDSSSSVYCFDESGTRLWKLGTGCGSALSMQFFQDRLYLVTTAGHLACMDVSEAAIQAAQQGQVPQAVQVKAPAVAAALPATTLETTSDISRGVVLECITEGGELRVRVVSAGFNPNLRVQFPRNIRQAGRRYLVEEVRLSAQGTFYRAYGDIKQVV
jgi:outer membrane protein assembly factor BamB